MDFNVSTFVLEILNFLVLVWILQRLFYQPLLDIIAKRQRNIEQTLANAQQLQQQAEEQRNLYENRQKLWEQERHSAQQTLQAQLEAERARQLAKLHSELTQERQKLTVTWELQQQEQLQQLEQQALKNAARFAAALLQQTACPELERHLFELLITRLPNLPVQCQQYLKTASGAAPITVNIASTYPLNAKQQQALETQLSALTTRVLTFHYHQQPELIAGLRIDIGAWVFNANVQQELIAFAELAHDIP